MTRPDEMRVTFDQNPAMMEATAQTAIGEKIEFKVIGTVKNRTPEGLDITIEAAVPEGYEVDDEETAGTIGNGVSFEDVPMTPTAMMVRRKAASK